ncbi:MAG: fasciclin domain-containing protein [Planctomycetota bacterium]
MRSTLHFLLLLAAAGAARGDTLLDAARQSGRCQTFCEAVAAAGLSDALAGPGPFTVFVPTDEAFAALPEGALAALLAEPARLKSVLLHHVARGKVTAQEVAGFETVRTLAGRTLPISNDAAGVRVGGARVVTADLAAENGVLHLIGAVLLPEEQRFDVGEYFPVAPQRDYVYRRTLTRRGGRSERSQLVREGSPGPDGLVRFDDNEGEFLLMGSRDGRPVMGGQSMRAQGFEQRYEPPIPLFPRQAAIGERHTYRSKIAHETRFMTFEGTLEREVELVGVEDVETPAGTFPACLKFKVTSANRPYGERRPFVARTEETVWLAKGVGEVKSVNQTSLESLGIPWLTATIELELERTTEAPR